MNELHCWEGVEDEQLRGYTCLLEADHEGPHDFAPDSAIVVQFVDDSGGDSAS